MRPLGNRASAYVRITRVALALGVTREQVADVYVRFIRAGVCPPPSVLRRELAQFFRAAQEPVQ